MNLGGFPSVLTKKDFVISEQIKLRPGKQDQQRRGEVLNTPSTTRADPRTN